MGEGNGSFREIKNYRFFKTNYKKKQKQTIYNCSNELLKKIVLLLNELMFIKIFLNIVFLLNERFYYQNFEKTLVFYLNEQFY